MDIQKNLTQFDLTKYVFLEIRYMYMADLSTSQLSRAVATGQSGQPMGWPGFWIETSLSYFLQGCGKFCYNFYKSNAPFFKIPSFLQSILKATWKKVSGFGLAGTFLSWAGLLEISRRYSPAFHLHSSMYFLDNFSGKTLNFDLKQCLVQTFVCFFVIVLEYMVWDYF